jgi:hypothetical protein
MQNLELIGRWVFIFGIALAVVGGILWLLGRIPGLQNLPGTIKIETSGMTCLIPLLASIVISLVLTIVLNVIIRIANR